MENQSLHPIEDDVTLSDEGSMNAWQDDGVPTGYDDSEEDDDPGIGESELEDFEEEDDFGDELLELFEWEDGDDIPDLFDIYQPNDGLGNGL